MRRHVCIEHHGSLKISYKASYMVDIVQRGIQEPHARDLVLLIFYPSPYTHETSAHDSRPNLRSADEHSVVIFR